MNKPQEYYQENIETINAYFIISNDFFMKNYLLFKNSIIVKLFEDFKEEVSKVSPIIVQTKEYEIFDEIYKNQIENNTLNLIFSYENIEVINDELKKILEIFVEGEGNFLFRFYDNYIFDFTILEIGEKIKFLSKYIEKWYWNDIDNKENFIDFNFSSRENFKLKISKKNFENINDKVFPFSLVPKFKEYMDFAGFNADLRNENEWYKEVVKRMNYAYERNIFNIDDVKLYSILSFGLGDSCFDKYPFNEAISRVLMEKISLEKSIEKINLAELERF